MNGGSCDKNVDVSQYDNACTSLPLDYRYQNYKMNGGGYFLDVFLITIILIGSVKIMFFAVGVMIFTRGDDETDDDEYVENEIRNNPAGQVLELAQTMDNNGL